MSFLLDQIIGDCERYLLYISPHNIFVRVAQKNTFSKKLTSPHLIVCSMGPGSCRKKLRIFYEYLRVAWCPWILLFLPKFSQNSSFWIWSETYLLWLKLQNFSSVVFYDSSEIMWNNNYLHLTTIQSMSWSSKFIIFVEIGEFIALLN